MNKRWHLTPEELEQIRELALNRFSNTAIATQMRITRNSVALAKRKMGLPVWPALPEAEILELLRSGLTARAIARTLGVSIRGTAELARQHGFIRVRYDMSPPKRAQIDRMILRHEKSAAMIAKTCGASYKYVLSRAHTLLGCSRFLPVWKFPLRSDFPQTIHEVTLET